MKKTKMIKSAAFTVAAVAAVTAAFMGVTQTIVTAEYNNVDKTLVSYSAAGAASSTKRPVPEGYVKADYTVTDSLFGTETPTEKDIPRDEAAETGVQALYELYQLDMAGKTVSMAYYTAGNGMRSQWSGSYWVDGIGTLSDVYSFSVDSITGELLTVQYDRYPENLADVELKDAFDLELHENPQDYEALAISYVEKYNIIAGPIEKAEYNRQESDYIGGVVYLFVYGENGERAFLAISLEDDTLSGVAYNAGCNQLDELDKWLEEEAKKEQ